MDNDATETKRTTTESLSEKAKKFLSEQFPGLEFPWSSEELRPGQMSLYEPVPVPTPIPRSEPCPYCGCPYANDHTMDCVLGPLADRVRTLENRVENLARQLAFGS